MIKREGERIKPEDICISWTAEDSKALHEELREIRETANRFNVSTLQVLDLMDKYKTVRGAAAFLLMMEKAGRPVVKTEKPCDEKEAA